MTTTETVASPRALARQRRRASVARFWRQYRSERAGLYGLTALSSGGSTAPSARGCTG